MLKVGASSRGAAEGPRQAAHTSKCPAVPTSTHWPARGSEQCLTTEGSFIERITLTDNSAQEPGLRLQNQGSNPLSVSWVPVVRQGILQPISGYVSSCLVTDMNSDMQCETPFYSAQEGLNWGFLI